MWSRLVAAVHVVIDNSLLLLAGAATALIWANIDLEQYEAFSHLLHFAANDIGMVFFFALAAKEVFEATLPGGPLSSARQAAVPVLAAVGGMVAPAALYLLGVLVVDRPEIARGWAIPCATDIAFSYLVARLVFRPGHPAIPFLLLLAIADDAMGLLILAVAYPSGPLAFGQLALWFVPAIALAWALRKGGVTSFWAYVFGPGVLSWFALYIGGIHPALALVPIVPFMPHEKVPRLLFGGRPAEPAATMDDFEHWWRVPVQFVLLIFGLANAGVPLSSVGSITGLVIAGLVIGKPLGIIGTTLVADRLGFERADDLDYRALLVLGIAAGIGFTVALFFTTAAFPPGEVLNEAKMGALLSFFAAPLAIVVARLLSIRRT